MTTGCGALLFMVKDKFSSIWKPKLTLSTRHLKCIKGKLTPNWLIVFHLGLSFGSYLVASPHISHVEWINYNTWRYLINYCCYCVSYQLLQEVALQGLRPEVKSCLPPLLVLALTVSVTKIPIQCPRSWTKIIQLCWAAEPAGRPSFVQILEMIRKSGSKKNKKGSRTAEQHKEEEEGGSNEKEEEEVEGDYYSDDSSGENGNQISFPPAK